MPEKENKSAGVAAQVAERIQGSDNVLVALSKNPSVDDLSAALGLTFILDKMEACDGNFLWCCPKCDRIPRTGKNF